MELPHIEHFYREMKASGFGLITVTKDKAPDVLKMVEYNGITHPIVSDTSDAATGQVFDRGALLAELLNAFEPDYVDFLAHGPDDALDRWRRFGRLGMRCGVEREGKRMEGIAVGIDRDGALRVRDDTGQEHRVLSGEVTVV